jgi:site-specific DNA recombinase
MGKGAGFKKVAIYSRKSKFTGKGESVENQIQWCRQYIFSHFENIEEKDILIYEDEGFSGGNTKRPHFRKMMEDAEKREFCAVVCYRLDRISRNIQDFAKLIEKLSRCDIAFISIKEQFDTSTPLGRAMMFMASVFSQLERETIAERIRDNMVQLAKTGRWLGGITPTGYASASIEKVTIDGKVKKVCQLAPVSTELALVRLIYARFLSSQSLTKTETYLVQKGYKTKNQKPFTRFAIKNILKNPVYMTADTDSYAFFAKLGVELCAVLSDFDGCHGIMAYNKTIQKSGKANKTRDMAQWIVAVGQHKGVVSGADWIKVQNLLIQNSSKAYRRPKNSTALLSGLLFCGGCGHYMRPKLSQRKNKKGELTYSYLCQLKEKSRCQNCKMNNPPGNLLDEAVLEAIKDLAPHPKELLFRLREGQGRLLASSTDDEAELSRLCRSLGEKEKEIGFLVSSLAEAETTPARKYIIEKINTLYEEKKKLNLQKEELLTLSKKQDLSPPLREGLKSQLLSFSNLLDTMNTEEKREALRLLVDKVVWDGKEAHIYFLGSREGKNPSV